MHPRISEPAIDDAMRTLTDFIKVNKGYTPEHQLNAVDALATGAGIDSATWEALCGKIAKVVDSPGGELGWALVGFILGLYASQYEQERHETGGGLSSI